MPICYNRCEKCGKQCINNLCYKCSGKYGEDIKKYLKSDKGRKARKETNHNYYERKKSKQIGNKSD